MAFAPSKYQSAIFDYIANNRGQHLVVEALAGSGKTTTGVQVFDLIPYSYRSIFVAFNKHIATELQKRLPNAEVRTYHALGFQFIRNSLGKVEVDFNKTDKILERVLSKYSYRHLYYPVKRLVSLVKGSLLPTDYATLIELSEYFGIDLNGDADIVFDTVRKVIDISAYETKTIDFDDMCWLPVHLGILNPIYDFVFVDELQDTNATQTALVLGSAKSNGRIVGVGDRYQSIYAFRGADSDAMPNFIKSTKADTLPLSITYRNPLGVVNLVRERFPDLGLEARDNAPDGEIRNVKYEQAIQDFIPGDMILCRVNADLVRPCFELIRQGVKATIKGRDIGQNLHSMIKRMKAEDIYDLTFKLREHYEIESSKLMAADKNVQLQLLTDKIETIYALSDGCKTIEEVTDKINLVFSDDVAAVTFSSIHKAKGLEAENVYILRPDLLPHPMAKKPWERQQESNLEYVACTRTLDKLTFVEGGK